MKYLSEIELYTLRKSAESQKDEKLKTELVDYDKKYVEVRKFAGALVSSKLSEMVESIMRRCDFDILKASKSDDSIAYLLNNNQISEERAKAMYLYNQVYKVFLGDEKYDKIRDLKKLDENYGKKYTTPDFMSISCLYHFYKYENEVIDELTTNSRVKDSGMLAKILKGIKQGYAQDTHINMGFDIEKDCTISYIPCKAGTKLDILKERYKSKQEKGVADIFSPLSINKMELSEYIISYLTKNNRGQIVEFIEKYLNDERARLFATRSQDVRSFYDGTVSEILIRMKQVNETNAIKINQEKKLHNKQKVVERRKASKISGGSEGKTADNGSIINSQDANSKIQSDFDTLQKNSVVDSKDVSDIKELIDLATETKLVGADLSRLDEGGEIKSKTPIWVKPLRTTFLNEIPAPNNENMSNVKKLSLSANEKHYIMGMVTESDYQSTDSPQDYVREQVESVNSHKEKLAEYKPYKYGGEVLASKSAEKSSSEIKPSLETDELQTNSVAEVSGVVAKSRKESFEENTSGNWEDFKNKPQTEKIIVEKAEESKCDESGQYKLF